MESGYGRSDSAPEGSPATTTVMKEHGRLHPSARPLSRGCSTRFSGADLRAEEHVRMSRVFFRPALRGSSSTGNAQVTSSEDCPSVPG
jgi:hypothetical protein